MFKKRKLGARSLQTNLGTAIRVKEAIEVYLEAEGYEHKNGVELVGFQIVKVSAN